MQGHTAHSSWQELVAAPAVGSHLLQVYDSDDFLVAAASAFAAAGLARGEAVVLNGTAEHGRRVCAALRSRDLDVEAALARGQLVLTPPPEQFVQQGLDEPKLAGLSRDARFAGLRWWGETSSFLYQRGDEKAALACEDFANGLARRYRMKMLCSLLCDRFDAKPYHGVLPEMCGRHSHLIPARDYVRHRLAVNRAIAEVLGEIRGPLLQSLLSWKHSGCEVPSSQAVLFWLRDTLPERLQAVLARLKSYEVQEAS